MSSKQNRGRRDFIIGGATDIGGADSDRALVLNDESVAVWEGDPVDLAGNGLNDDDAFVANYQANNMFLSDGRTVYFFGVRRNGSGAREAAEKTLWAGTKRWKWPADLRYTVL